MRYFEYVEPDNQENMVVTVVSEEEIRESYYPFWKEWAIRDGENIDLSFDNCLDNWICLHWAKEINRP